MTWRRVVRFVAIAAGTVLVLAALLVVPIQGRTLVPAWVWSRVCIGLLRFLLGVHAALLLAAPAGAIIAAVLLVRARRRRVAAPLAARALLLGVSCLIGLALVEAGAAAWYVRGRRYPVLPTHFPTSHQGRSGDVKRRELIILVIGESSALGMPYDHWLSVGELVAWQLGRVFPGRRCRVVMRATPGSTITQVHDDLAALRIRPDIVLIYSGHNEFLTRFTWSRNVPYYSDGTPPESTAARFERLGKHSYLGLAVNHAIALRQVGEPPPRAVTRELIDVPAFTRDEAREVVANYAGRLDAIVAYCARIGALPILIVPAGNDGAFEPNRSMLRPETPRAERTAFAREFQHARQVEAENSSRAETIYRALIERQPGFAEAHFRLARLRARAGDWSEARHHFALARDQDGMPERCIKTLQDACRQVQTRHDCILVDAPALFETLVPDGILDDRLFHDAHHPTLLGYIALAQDILNQLQARRALGWPEGTSPLRIDPDECSRRFGMNARAWAGVCLYGGLWYQTEAFIRHDPRARLEQARRLLTAVVRITAGIAPEASGIAGIGCHPDLSRPQLGPAGAP